MKKYIILLIIAYWVNSSAIFAQSVASYDISLPEKVLPMGSKIFIDNFKYTGTEADITDFNNKLKTSLKSNLTNNYYSSYTKVVPWLKRNFYTVVDDISQATHIISGQYGYNKSAKKTSSELRKAYLNKKAGLRSDGLNDDGGLKETQAIYAHYYVFNESQNFGFFGKIVLKSKAGKIIHTVPIKSNENQAVKSKLVKKGEIDAAKTIQKLAKNELYSHKNIGFLSSSVKKCSYNMCRIKKSKNKANKKKIKGLTKEAKKLLKADNFACKQAGKIYLQILAIESSPEVLFNIGKCYEAMGNYTKALHYIGKSGKESVAGIQAKIGKRKKLETLGATIVENDF